MNEKLKATAEPFDNVTIFFMMPFVYTLAAPWSKKGVKK